MIALDYTTRIDPAALKAAGVTTVCRYLSWLYRWQGTTHTFVNPKIIQRQEYDELRANGFEIVLNWEYDSADWLGGKDAGAAHAAEAVRQAQLLGHPKGSVVAGSADFDMTRAQWDAAGHAYASSWEAGVRAGGFVPGVYGPWDVLTWCRDETGLEWFWQAGMSTSFSAGRNRNAWPGAHLRQRGYKTVGGVAGDWNDILIVREADMSTHSDEILERFRGGFPFMEDGKTEVVPVQDIIDRKQWQGSVDAKLAALKDEVTALGTGSVDLDALAAKVAGLLAPLAPSASEVAAQIIQQLASK